MPDQTTIADFEGMVAEAWDSARDLQHILTMMSERKGVAAADLRARIASRIDQIRRSPRSGRNSTTNGRWSENPKTSRPAHSAPSTSQVTLSLSKTLAFLEADKGILRQELGRVNYELQQALLRCRELEQQVSVLHHDLLTLRQSGSPTGSRANKWGITASCPGFIVKAVQKEWRKRLHPDSHPHASPTEKASLDRQFREMEADFRGMA